MLQEQPNRNFKKQLIEKSNIHLQITLLLFLFIEGTNNLVKTVYLQINHIMYLNERPPTCTTFT